ncbi:hypothetical protein IM660_11805 [Ruania alkalisoli]|uniref:Uncharacterized protein n=1 Tax=Ruania alkalisoli TaxID=2779775 RepID=A0A7M1SRG9_9MICO|nr:hypothetical protein [Ruania alkalisoli]QOR69382.1 hypothetical protein IM660_11805 [Ruania alkalisoli]
MAANALHESLVETLLAHGRLVFVSDDEAREFVRAVRGIAGMPPGARARWEAMLVHLRKSHRVVVADPPSRDTLATVDGIDRLRAGWGGQADVAVVSQTLSVTLGVPGDTGILSAPGLKPDVAVAVTAPTAPALARIVEQERSPFAAHGTAREDFWFNVLRPIATGAREVVILDGYLFNRITGSAYGRGSASDVPEHICWLLEHLDSVMAGGSTVRLVGNASKLNSRDDACALAQIIHHRWSPANEGRLARVEVHLGDPSNGRQRFPHDRHIRFSTGSAVKIPAGFDRLRDRRIWDTSGMWWTYLWRSRALDALRSDEQTATSLARHPLALALSRADSN